MYSGEGATWGPVLNLNLKGLMSLFDVKEQTKGLLTYSQDPRARVPFGYSQIDQKVLRNGGLAPGDVTMLIGRSEVGKTWFLTNILWHMARDDNAILDVSLEMSTPQKVLRMMCIAYELSAHALELGLKNGEPGAMEWLDKYEQDFPNYAVMKPQDTDGVGFDEIDREMEAFEKRVGMPPRIVALDFLGLMKRDKYDGQDVVRIPKLAAQAERWADAREVSLIILHQTGRQNEVDPTRRNHGATPLDMTDAMYGGEANMDYVFGVYRPAKAPPPSDTESEEYLEWETMVFAERNTTYLQVLKNRHNARPPEQQYPGIKMTAEWPSGRLSEATPLAGVVSINKPLRQSGAAFSHPKD